MTYSQYLCLDSGPLDLSLTATEYRLLGDMLLEQIETDPVRNDALRYLAQRLFVLAVQADGRDTKTPPHQKLV